MSKENLSEKSSGELVSLLDEMTKELMKLKIQKTVGQLNAPHRIRAVRRNIARVKTLISASMIVVKSEG